MTDSNLIVIYDGECAVCSTVASILTDHPDIDLVGWHNPHVQEFLRIQFDTPPFTLLVVDPTTQTIHTGDCAVETLAERIDLPRPARAVLGGRYETLAGATQQISGSDRSLSSQHVSVPLAESAASRIDSLRPDR